MNNIFFFNLDLKMNTYEKLHAMLNSYEETIDEVVNFDVKIRLSHFLMIELLFPKRFFLTSSKLQIPSVVRMKIGLARALV
jgi:hypothetical protein